KRYEKRSSRDFHAVVPSCSRSVAPRQIICRLARIQWRPRDSAFDASATLAATARNSISSLSTRRVFEHSALDETGGHIRRDDSLFPSRSFIFGDLTKGIS